MAYVGSNALTSMPILLGHCQEVGHVDRLEIAVPDHTVQTGNCPLCGQVQTCEVHWREDAFTPSDMDIIRNQEDMIAQPQRLPRRHPRKVPPPPGHLCRPSRLHLRRPRRPATPSHSATQQLGHTHAVHSLCVPDQAVHDRQDGNQAFPPDGGTLAMAGAHLCAHHSVPYDEFLVVDPHPLTAAGSANRFATGAARFVSPYSSASR